MYAIPYRPIKVYLWTSASKPKLYIFDTLNNQYNEEHILIKENIYQDDTIENVLNKIGIYINYKDNNIYAWTDVPILFSVKNIKWDGYNTNPFKTKNNNSEQLNEPITYDYYNNNLFEFDKINIAFSSDINVNIHKYYFIDNKKLSSKEYKQRDNYIKTLVSSNHSNVEIVQEYYTRINFQSVIKPVILSDIFDNSYISDNIDIIQWIDDRSKILYKLSKQNKLKKEYIDSITNPEKIDRIQVINIYSVYKNNNICKISIDSTNVQINYILYEKYVRLDEIQQNNLLLFKTLQNIIKQPLNFKVLALNSTLQYNVQNSSFKTLIEKISKQIDIFNVVKKENKQKQTLVCIYKRSSNYNRNTNIYDYIRSRLLLGISKQEIAEEIINLGISDNVVQMINEEIEIINRGIEIKDRETLKLKDNGTIVIITPQSQGYNVSITNMSNITELKYLFFWLLKIISTSIDKNVQQNIPTEVKKSSSSKSSSEISKASSVSSYNSSGGVNNKIKKNNNYLINLLQQTDNNLFKEDYARNKCQSHVQPVVFSKKHKKYLEDNNLMHFDNTIEYGSSPQNINVYACPKLWCPQSKIPLELDKDSKCPLENEEPLILYKESDKYKKNYVKLIKKNENGMCVPCCGKNIQTKSAINTCMEYLKENKTNIDEQVDESLNLNDENYLMSHSAPIKIGRYGTIPEYLHSLLSNESYKKCTGALNTKIECFIRKGVQESKHESIIFSIMEILKIKNKESFINKVKSELDLIRFLSLDNGNIAKVFFNLSDNTIYNNDENLLKDFKKFNKNKTLSNLHLNMNNIKNISYILSVYKSYRRYINYLESNDMPINKNHKLIFPLIHEIYKVGIILWEKQNDEIFMHCFQTSFANNEMNPRFIMIMKEKEYYEPLILKKRSSEEKIIYKIDDFPKLKTMISKCQFDINDDIFNNLNILNNVVHQIMDNPNKFLIKTILINDDLTINKILTNDNILLKFKKIGVSYIYRFLNELNVKHNNIRFYQTMIGDKYNINANKNDIYNFTKKAKELKIDVIVGNEIPLNKENKQIYSSLTLLDDYDYSNTMTLHINLPNEMNSTLNKSNQKAKIWYDLQKMIGKTVLKKYKQYPLDRNQITKEIKEKYKNIPYTDIIQIILEEIPLDTSQSLSQWLSNVIIFAKYDYLSNYIKEDKKQFIFSQNSLYKNGIKVIPNELINYHKSLPIEYKKEKIINTYDINNLQKTTNIALPSQFLGPHKKLSVKWNKNKRSKLSQMVYINCEYTKATLPEFVNWFIKKLKITGTNYNEIEKIASKDYFDIMNDDDAMYEILHDSSYLNEWQSRGKKFNTIRLFLDKYYNTLDVNEKSKIIKSILDSGNLYPNDLVIKTISKILNISILLIQRGIYGKFNEENNRGGIEDLLISSKLFKATNYTDRPLLIFNKICDKSKCAYYLVVDKQDITKLYMNYNDVPEEIKEIIEKYN